MNRLCVLNVAGLSPRCLEGAGPLWLGTLPCEPAPLRPSFPVVRASTEATITTGAEPGRHGIVANGLFRRQAGTVSFSERSNTLLNRPRVWLSRRKFGCRPSVALVFWCHPLAGGADYVLGAASTGHMYGNVPAQPPELYDRLASEVGQVALEELAGPRASWRVCEWIAEASMELWRRERPDQMWVYLPGIDAELVRQGRGAEGVLEAVRQVDRQAARIAECVGADDGEVLVVSDGGYVPVSRLARPNLRLREAGLLEVSHREGAEAIDPVGSRAFALTDGQIAHLYCRDETIAEKAAEIVSADQAVGSVLPRSECFCAGLGHDRSGERIVLSAPDAWLAPYWWAKGEAPTLTGHGDATAKCGLDLAEWLVATGAGGADPSGVRASRGLVPAESSDWGVIAGGVPVGERTDWAMTDVADLVVELAGCAPVSGGG
jgi:hypothetical protein